MRNYYQWKIAKASEHRRIPKDWPGRIKWGMPYVVIAFSFIFMMIYELIPVAKVDYTHGRMNLAEIQALELVPHSYVEYGLLFVIAMLAVSICFAFSATLKRRFIPLVVWIAMLAAWPLMIFMGFVINDGISPRRQNQMVAKDGKTYQLIDVYQGMEKRNLLVTVDDSGWFYTRYEIVVNYPDGYHMNETRYVIRPKAMAGPGMRLIQVSDGRILKLYNNKVALVYDPVKGTYSHEGQVSDEAREPLSELDPFVMLSATDELAQEDVKALYWQIVQVDWKASHEDRLSMMHQIQHPSVLLKGLNHPNPYVREAAQTYLHKMKEEGWQAEVEAVVTP